MVMQDRLNSLAKARKVGKSRKRGQLSLDFLISLTLLLVFLQIFLTFNGNFLFNQEKSAIKLQAKSIVSEIHKGIARSFALEVNDDYQLKMDIPKIQVNSAPEGSQSSLVDCDIEITGSQIKLTVNNTHYAKLGSDEIVETIERGSWPPAVEKNFRCGDTLLISPARWTDGIEGNLPLVPKNCNDGFLDPNEQCDCGTDGSCTAAELNNQTCDTVYGGFSGSGLSCISPGQKNECTVDVSACTRPLTCTNALIGGVCKGSCNHPTEIEDVNAGAECFPGQVCCTSLDGLINDVCGNGIMAGYITGEQCDDGNQKGTSTGDGADGCDYDPLGINSCKIDTGWVCPGGANCEPICGDGIDADGALDGFEECDDGNLNNGDGCNALCQDE